MNPVEISTGDSPLILGLPHTGTFVPTPIHDQLNSTGRALADTDWHIDQLYDGLIDQVTTVRATFHRYVIDANRDPEGASLYPGQNTTELVPTTDFDGHDIWRTAPDSADIQNRRAAFHAPYHAAIVAQIARIRARHGFAILYDCHSIRSDIPFLFHGILPDFNIGTNLGATCDAQLAAGVTGLCQSAPGYSSVVNGRFKGGWTTRHYGRPNSGVHAIQMELAQSTYLTHQSPPWDYNARKAAQLRPILKDILTFLTNWRPA